MKGEEGVWGALALNENKSNKMELLLFDESDFFLLSPVYFLFSFNRAMLFILSQIKKRLFKKTTTTNKPDYQMVRP